MPTFPKLSYVCPIPWDSMRGDERERYCAKCARHVVNLSTLTEAQRAALLAQSKPEELCVAYYRRMSGQFVSAETPLSGTDSRAVIQYGIAAVTIGAAALAAAYIPAESATRVEQSVASQVDSAQRELAANTRQIVDKISERFSGKKKEQPVTMFVGMIACPPPPAATPPPSSSP